ncbi:MAG: SEC-C metal-binding domain-containing protein [Myxococcota bacterium]|nr:SEC-C metal-binding domain-containing protein [Myxococcota bacterium]
MDQQDPKGQDPLHGPGCSHGPEPAQHGPWDPAALLGRQPVYRTGPKVGRNDPCPCGSGKKYKRCHGS